MKQGLKGIIAASMAALQFACAGNSTADEAQQQEEETQRVKAEYNLLLQQTPLDGRRSILENGFRVGLTDSKEAMDVSIPCYGLEIPELRDILKSLDEGGKRNFYSTLSQKCEPNEFEKDIPRLINNLGASIFYAERAGELERARKLNKKLTSILVSEKSADYLGSGGYFIRVESLMDWYDTSKRIGDSKSAFDLSRKVIELVDKDARLRDHNDQRMHSRIAQAAREVGDPRAVYYAQRAETSSKLYALTEKAQEMRK